VRSSQQSKQYTVKSSQKDPDLNNCVCSCKDFRFRKQWCKHVGAVVIHHRAQDLPDVLGTEPVTVDLTKDDLPMVAEDDVVSDNDLPVVEPLTIDVTDDCGADISAITLVEPEPSDKKGNASTAIAEPGIDFLEEDEDMDELDDDEDGLALTFRLHLLRTRLREMRARPQPDAAHLKLIELAIWVATYFSNDR
jgi:hypothetical protein